MSIKQFSSGGSGFGAAAVARARAAGLSDAQIRQQVAAAGMTLGPAAVQSLGSSSGGGGGGSAPITSFSNTGTGFGAAAVDRARAAGLSDAQIRQQVSAAGLTLGAAAQQALGSPSDGATASRSSAPIAQFSSDGQGFGLTALNRARAQGLSDADIRQQVTAAGLKLGPAADQSIFESAVSGYQKNLQEELAKYKMELEEGFNSRLQEGLSSAQNQAMQLQSQLANAQTERDNAAAKAKEYEDQRKAEEEIQISQQLNSLRSGSTVSGSAGPGLGSLSSGRSSYSVSTGAKSGGVLDRAYKDIDPTDSVLNKDVAVASAAESRPNSSAQRSTARQRALAAGGSASDYYARRFG